MLTRTRRLCLSRLRDDRGFTLIELLVAMISAVVVTGALLTILDISMSETTLVSDKVQANQLGRTAMTRIVNELHSSCLAAGFKPIQEKSGENELIFKNAYSSEAVISNAKEAKVAGTGAFEHQIVWIPPKEGKEGTLTDYTYDSTSGEGTEAKFPEVTSNHEHATPSSGVLLASNVTQTEEKNAKGETIKVPIFRYYKYATESTSSSTTPDGTLAEIGGAYLPLKATGTDSAAEVASVLISFRQAPRDGKAEHDQYADFSNQVTLALSAPNSETPIQDAPCE